MDAWFQGKIPKKNRVDDVCSRVALFLEPPMIIQHGHVGFPPGSLGSRGRGNQGNQGSEKTVNLLGRSGEWYSTKPIGMWIMWICWKIPWELGMTPEVRPRGRRKEPQESCINIACAMVRRRYIAYGSLIPINRLRTISPIWLCFIHLLTTAHASLSVWRRRVATIPISCYQSKPSTLGTPKNSYEI